MKVSEGMKIHIGKYKMTRKQNYEIKTQGREKFRKRECIYKKKKKYKKRNKWNLKIGKEK